MSEINVNFNVLVILLKLNCLTLLQAYWIYLDMVLMQWQFNHGYYVVFSMIMYILFCYGIIYYVYITVLLSYTFQFYHVYVNVDALHQENGIFFTMTRNMNICRKVWLINKWFSSTAITAMFALLASRINQQRGKLITYVQTILICSTTINSHFEIFYSWKLILYKTNVKSSIILMKGKIRYVYCRKYCPW